MARAILSCLGLGLAAAAATAGVADLSADPSLTLAAASALGGVAGNLTTDLFKVLHRPVAERVLQGRSGIDENHHVASALRLTQLHGLCVVLDRFDRAWPSDHDDARRQGAERFTEKLKPFVVSEIARAKKADSPGRLAPTRMSESYAMRF